MGIVSTDYKITKDLRLKGISLDEGKIIPSGSLCKIIGRWRNSELVTVLFENGIKVWANKSDLVEI